MLYRATNRKSVSISVPLVSLKINALLLPSYKDQTKRGETIRHQCVQNDQGEEQVPSSSSEAKFALGKDKSGKSQRKNVGQVLCFCYLLLCSTLPCFGYCL